MRVIDIRMYAHLELNKHISDLVELKVYINWLDFFSVTPNQRYVECTHVFISQTFAVRSPNFSRIVIKLTKSTQEQHLLQY